MKYDSIFLKLENVDFDKELISIISSRFIIEEYNDDFSKYEKVRVIYARFSHTIDKDFLSRFPNLQYILCNATNISHINEFECYNANIEIISLRGEQDFLNSITATAELTWFLILALVRHGIAAISSVKLGEWNRNLFLGRQLKGRKIGILGLGRNGQKIVKYANAFEMEVLAYDPIIKNFNGIELVASIEDIFIHCEIVCITITSNESTNKIINKHLLDKLQKSAVIVNTARGEVVDENYILYLLENKIIAGYATDVLSNEFDINNNPLFLSSKRLNNLIITPHIGGVTIDSWRQTERFVVEKLFKIMK